MQDYEEELNLNLADQYPIRPLTQDDRRKIAEFTEDRIFCHRLNKQDEVDYFQWELEKFGTYPTPDSVKVFNKWGRLYKQLQIAHENFATAKLKKYIGLLKKLRVALSRGDWTTGEILKENIEQLKRCKTDLRMQTLYGLIKREEEISVSDRTWAGRKMLVEKAWIQAVKELEALKTN